MAGLIVDILFGLIHVNCKTAEETNTLIKQLSGKIENLQK